MLLGRLRHTGSGKRVRVAHPYPSAGVQLTTYKNILAILKVKLSALLSKCHPLIVPKEAI